MTTDEVLPMCSSIRSLACVALLSVAVGCAEAAVPPPPAAAEVQLRAINHRFVNAFFREDVEFMEALTDHNFLLTTNGGDWLGRAEHLESMRHPSGLEGVAYRDVEVRLFGEVALIHGVFEALAPGGKTRRVRYTDAYVWNGAGWRLVSAQNTPIKDDVPTAPRVGTMPAHAPWTGQDPTGDDLEVLRKLNESYVEAFRQSDVAWYDAHLAPDYRVFSGDGSYNDRAMALANFAQPTFATRMKSFPVGKVSIRRFGDIALIHAENAYELKDGRQGVSRYTDIWQKQDGQWRCILAHINVHKSPG
jgi:ketosteroid isomerase-like protein